MNTIELTSVQQTVYLTRPDGRIGYDVSGDGRLVVLVPGMGDLRAAYRFLAPAVREAGYRVACTDLRGHGDSDTARCHPVAVRVKIVGPPARVRRDLAHLDVLERHRVRND